MAPIFIDELAAVDPRLIRQFNHGTINLHDAPVDAIQLINQCLNPVIVQMKPVDQLDNFSAQCLICCLFCLSKAAIFIQSCRNPRILHIG